MAKRIRCRCPVCGMLVTQKQLNEEHDFEFRIQEIGSKGRGGIYHIYRDPDKVEGNTLLYFKVALAGKLHDIADRLLEAVRAEAAEDIPTYETDERDELVASSQLTSATGYDEIPVTELETKRGGEEEWQGSGELSPQTVLED